MALSASVWGLAKEILALFGCLCLVFNVLLPTATSVLQLAVHDAPEQFARWKTHRAQQRELHRIERKIELLKKRLQRDSVDEVEARNQRRDISESAAATQQQQQRKKKLVRDPSSVSSRQSTIQTETKLSVRRRHTADGKRSRSSTHQERTKPSKDETPKLVQSQHRHRLSIYPTVKKPPRPKDRAELTGNDRLVT